MRTLNQEPLTLKDYPLITDINNPPLCKCGCGKPVTKNKSYANNRWSIYLFNHHHNVNRKLCKCGCGNKVEKSWYSFIPGHKVIKELPPFCKCGCGERVYNIHNKYLPGHKELFNYKNNLTQNKKHYITELPFCKCGCGERVLQPHAKFFAGHYSEILKKERQTKVQEALKKAPLCKCGCNQIVNIKTLYPLVYNTYITGHNHRLEEDKIKMRVMCSEMYCPNIGKLEFEIFPKLQEVCSFKIYCLTNQRKTKCGYHLDGYIEELNLVIEIDESFHNHKESKLKDPIRENNIKQELNCDFFRIKQNTWCEFSEQIIKEFSEKISTLKITKNL